MSEWKRGRFSSFGFQQSVFSNHNETSWLKCHNNSSGDSRLLVLLDKTEKWGHLKSGNFWVKGEGHKLKIKFAVSLILAKWSACLIEISADRILVFISWDIQESPQNGKRSSRATFRVGWCLCWLYLCRKKMSFSCSVHLGWYLMGLVISPEIHKENALATICLDNVFFRSFRIQETDVL